MTSSLLVTKFCYFAFENLGKKILLTNFAVFRQSFKLLYNKINTDMTLAVFKISVTVPYLITFLNAL